MKTGTKLTAKGAQKAFKNGIDDIVRKAGKGGKGGNPVAANPKGKVKGGAHKNLDFDSATQQRHHMPSQAAGNKGGNGGAITMDTIDHKRTASFDNKPGAAIYREKQKKLVDSGNFAEAFEMDIKDIHSKFGNKYDDAIKQLREWYKGEGVF